MKMKVNTNKKVSTKPKIKALKQGDVISQGELLKKFWKYFDEECVAVNCNDEERDEVITDFFNSL